MERLQAGRPSGSIQLDFGKVYFSQMLVILSGDIGAIFAETMLNDRRTLAERLPGAGNVSHVTSRVSEAAGLAASRCVSAITAELIARITNVGSQEEKSPMLTYFTELLIRTRVRISQNEAESVLKAVERTGQHTAPENKLLAWPRLLLSQAASGVASCCAAAGIRRTRGWATNSLPIRSALGAALLTSLVGAAQAMPVDINGGTSWAGWELRGNSNDQGIWASGSTTVDYQIYTATFLLDAAQSATGADTKIGGAPAGPMDLSGWNAGERILGVGIKAVSGLGAFNPSLDRWSNLPFINFDFGNGCYNAASSVGGTDGSGSISGCAANGIDVAGMLATQVNGDFNNLYRPNGLSIFNADGTFTNYGNTLGYAAGVWPYIRSFWDPVGTTWQTLFNLDQLAAEYSVLVIGSDFRIMTAASSAQRSVLDISFAAGPTPVPEPGTLVLLALALFSLAVVRARRPS
jgi:hypothetical protein